MFNKDYEVYKDEKSTDNRWLFLNREGKAFSSSARIDLENYVREDEENPKKGEVLWTAKYDENPDFKQKYASDSSSDGFSDVEGFGRGFVSSNRKMMMNWKLETKATLKSVKYEGLKYKIKVKAKGIATREVHIHHVKDEETGQTREVISYEDHEYVKKISYKIQDKETGDTVDKFKIKGLTGSELKWKCDAFKATKEGGFFFPGPTIIDVKGTVDPAFCLLMGHICSSEFAPAEIKKDLHPSWPTFRH